MNLTVDFEKKETLIIPIEEVMIEDNKIFKVLSFNNLTWWIQYDKTTKTLYVDY